jgi:hypothetical protein
MVSTETYVFSQQSTSVIPIVFAGTGEPADTGLVVIWRDRVAMLRVYRSSSPILVANERLFLLFAG